MIYLFWMCFLLSCVIVSLLVEEKTMTKSIVWGEKRCCQAWQQRLTSLVYLQPNNWYWHLAEWTIMKTKSSVFSAVFTLRHLFSWFINLEDRVQQRRTGHFLWDERKFVVFWNDEQVCNVFKCVHCDVLSVAWEQLPVPNVSV